jgi:hypothetical protein
MVNYLKRVSDVKKENSKRIAGVKRKEGLYKRVQAAKI